MASRPPEKIIRCPQPPPSAKGTPRMGVLPPPVPPSLNPSAQQPVVDASPSAATDLPSPTPEVVQNSVSPTSRQSSVEAPGSALGETASGAIANSGPHIEAEPSVADNLDLPPPPENLSEISTVSPSMPANDSSVVASDRAELTPTPSSPAPSDGSVESGHRRSVPPAVLPKPARAPSTMRPSQPPPPRPSQLTPPPPSASVPLAVQTPEGSFLPPPPPASVLSPASQDTDFPAPPECITTAAVTASVDSHDPLDVLEEHVVDTVADDASSFALPSPGVMSSGAAVLTDDTSVASSINSSLDSAIFSSATTESIRSHTPQPGSHGDKTSPGKKVFVPTPATPTPPWVKTPGDALSDVTVRQSNSVSAKPGRSSVREKSSMLEGVLRLQQPEEFSKRTATIDETSVEATAGTNVGVNADDSRSVTPQPASPGVRPATPDSAKLSIPSTTVASSFRSPSSASTQSEVQESAGDPASPGTYQSVETVPVVLGNTKNLNRKEMQFTVKSKRRPRDDNSLGEYNGEIGDDDPFRVVSFSGPLGGDRPTIHVARPDPTGETARRGLSPDDIVQVRTFYQGNKSEVTVCSCLATLYTAEEAPEIKIDAWKPAHVGVALFVVDKGEARRPKGVSFVFAEKGTGFLLWSSKMNWDSKYHRMESNFHRFRDSSNPRMAVGIAFQDADSADQFKAYIDKVAADKDLNLLNDPSVKPPKKGKKRGTSTKKKAMPKRSEISQPCQFTHVTQLKRGEETGDIHALTMVPITD